MHLSVVCWCRYPGLVPGDSTAKVPRELPKLSDDSGSSVRTSIDISSMPEEDLMAMSRDSADAPLGAMFPIPPGILPNREAHMTGAQVQLHQAFDVTSWLLQNCWAEQADGSLINCMPGLHGCSCWSTMIAIFAAPQGKDACTGHRPLKRQRKTVVPLSTNEAAAQIGQYMAGELKDEPWHAFGLSKAPIVGGISAPQ